MVSATGSAANTPVMPKPIRGRIKISGISSSTFRNSAKNVAFLASPMATKVFWADIWKLMTKFMQKNTRNMGTAVSMRLGSELKIPMSCSGNSIRTIHANVA